MKSTYPPRPGPITSLRSHLGVIPLLAALFLVVGSPSQAAPGLTSSSPANNATAVPVGGPLVLTFSEPMDEKGIIPSFPPFLVGNFETTPADLLSSAGCTWSDDGLRLSCKPGGAWPASTTITWRLNPPGATLPFTSVGGAAVPTTSGSFTTGTGGGDPDPDPGTGPKLVSTTPANGATGVSVSSTIVFVFDQALVPVPQVGGIPPFVKGPLTLTGTGLVAAQFNYTWSQDAKTLTCTYTGNLPGNTTISWSLNAADAIFFFENEGGEQVARTTGSFTTGEGSGEPGCDPDLEFLDWGDYVLGKNSQYEQSSPADPVPASETAFTFSSFVGSPTAGPTVTNASVTLPNGTRKDLSSPGPFLMLFLLDEAATAAELDTAYPGGTYTMRFTQTGLPERVVSMNLPAATPPVPKIANYAAGQAIDPAADFTLQWGAFTGAGADDGISLTIMDGANLVFSAPDPCVPRELVATATSILIPANTLQISKIYQCDLNFGRQFYLSTNAYPMMVGYGAVSRSTSFTLSTGGTTPANPARFTAWELLPNGHPKLTFEGSAFRSYVIQRSPPNFGSPTWTPAGTVTVSVKGVAVFEDMQSGAFPLIYRAVAAP